MDPFIGEIRMFGFNYAPQGWAICNGQHMDISQNQALYSLLGSIYGGDDRTYFNLPDLRSRLPMCMGQGPGLTNRLQGQAVGREYVTLGIPQMPNHNHPATATATATLQAYKDPADKSDPTDSMLGGAASYKSGGRTKVQLDGDAISVNAAVAVEANGGQQPFEVVSPALPFNFCIALQGIFPSRP